MQHCINFSVSVFHAANVLLKSSPSAKHGFTVRIADFGLSRMADDDQEPDNMTGTPMYKSPESLNSGTFSKVSQHVAGTPCPCLLQLAYPVQF